MNIVTYSVDVVAVGSRIEPYFPEVLYLALACTSLMKSCGKLGILNVLFNVDMCM